MKIAVLLKQVPDLVEELEVAGDGRSLDAGAVKWRLNEFDDHALEEALLLKERGGAEVTAIAADGAEADKILFTALAKGADRALKVATAGDGNLPLAAALAAVLAARPHDLVLTGVQAADDRDGQLAPMVAALLRQPCVEVVTGIELAGGARAALHKEYAGGVMAELEVDLPAVLGVQAARQPPRYAPVSKVRQVQQSAKIETVAAAGDGAAGGPVVVEMTPPPRGEGAEMLESVDELVKVLESKGVMA